MDNKVLVTFAREVCGRLGQQLAFLPIKVYLADTLTELARLVRDGHVFQVVILPAALPEAEPTSWEIYSELSLLSVRPELLVCARAVNFRLWSSVLDAGGYDVLTEPFSLEELQSAVSRAIESFQKRTGASELAIRSSKRR